MRGRRKPNRGRSWGCFRAQYVRREREKKTTRIGSRVGSRVEVVSARRPGYRTEPYATGGRSRAKHADGDDDDDGDEYDDDDARVRSREGRWRCASSTPTSSSSSSFDGECDDDAMPTRSSRRRGVSSVVVFDVFVVVFIDARRDGDDEGDWRKRRRRRRWWARAVSRSGVGRSDDGERANWTGINNINDEDAYGERTRTLERGRRRTTQRQNEWDRRSIFVVVVVTRRKR